jgi:hypothetical protein
MRPCKLLLSAIGATVLLGALVSGASARDFALSNQTFRVTFRRVVFSGFFGNFNCQLTLEGSLHARSIAKVAERLIGYVTAAPLGPCIAGTATILRETLPWHVRYRSFSGLLPNINSIEVNIIGFSVEVRETLGIICLATSTAARPLVAIFSRNTATREFTTAILRSSIPDGCGTDMAVESDAGPVTQLSSATRLTVTLF